MSNEEFITDLFCRIDDILGKVPKHSQANLFPSEVVTLGILCAIKGVGNRAFYRWVKENLQQLFPDLPERTRLFRLFKTRSYWTKSFLADPTLFGVADTYGIELIHPIREGRSKNQIGQKGISNHRWIVGCKLALILNQYGLVVDWDCNTANVHDTEFLPLVEKFKEKTIVCADNGFHTKEGDPSNLKICQRGSWNNRMIVETVFSMLTTVCHFKKVAHRIWDYFRARLAFTMAAFNVLVQWHGLRPDENGFIHLSIAEFSL